MSVTDELNELIALHGNARDALNVTLAKLRQAESEIAVLKEAAQQLRASDKCPDCGGSGFMVKIDSRKVTCLYCDGTGICA